MTYTSFHCNEPGDECGGGIYSGWIEPNDEYFVTDTNEDGRDDLVFINRVPNPEDFRQIDIGFVGMVVINPAKNNAILGFDRFFDWNFAAPGESSVFPGYDDEDDQATGGLVVNNRRSQAVMLLINSEFDGNPEAAAYAVLQPAPKQDGQRDRFQLISTVFRKNVAASSFDIDDTFFMDDVTADGTEEVISYSRASSETVLRGFDAFSGTVLSRVPTASGTAGFVAIRESDAHTLSNRPPLENTEPAGLHIATPGRRVGAEASEDQKIKINGIDQAFMDSPGLLHIWEIPSVFEALRR